MCCWWLLLVLLFLMPGTCDALPRASGVGYIGRGYDIIQGNPNGVPLGGSPPASASDPGIKSNNWLDLTYNLDLTDAQQLVTIPDQISYSLENSCLDIKSSSVITTDKQYQDKLSLSVDISARGGFGLGKFAFTGAMSHNKETSRSIKSKKAYYEENYLCSYGKATYRFGNDRMYLRLTQDSMRLVCRLPTYMSNDYFGLINAWGTHYISEATLGSKKVHRKETVMSNFLESVLQSNGVNSGVEASYMGQSGSLGVKVDTSSVSKNSEYMFGSKEVSWTMGSENYHNPTQIKLQPITDLLEKGSFWDVACTDERVKWGDCCNNLETIKSIMEKALEAYPVEYLKVQPPESDLLTLELVWPEGTYALHSVRNKCPRGNGFDWAKGTVFQDTDDWSEKNSWSQPINWQDYQLALSSITQIFCVKGIRGANEYELKWPPGDYCINKFMECPSGFQESFVVFDDENVYNKNWQKGSVPAGVYDKDTKLLYCCRNDRSPLQPIRLPSTEEFYLVRRGTQCQEVHNMRVNTEWVEWSLETWWGLDKEKMVGGDMRPYTIIKDDKLRLFFCRYVPVATAVIETITIDIG